MARFRSLAMNKHARTGNFLTKIDEQIDRVSEAINREMKAIQLSSISDDLGDMFAGRFIAPSSSATSAEPTDSGFTGSFISANGETFDGTDYHVGAAAAGVLGVGFNTAGQLLWGAGKGILDVDGLYIAADSVSGGGANPNKIRLGSSVTEIFALYDTGEAYHRQNTGVAGSDLAEVLHQAISSSGTAYIKLASSASGVYVDISPALRIGGTAYGVSTPIGGVPAATIAGGATRYISIYGSAFLATEGGWIAPRAGTLQNFYLYLSSGQPATGSLVLTVRKAGGDTTLTITVAAGGASPSYSDTAHTVAIAAGDIINGVKVVNNAATASAQVESVTMEFV